MNVFHRYLCASTGWRRRVSATVLPWVLDGVDLGSEVLEIGSGYGAATDGLRACVGHLTCAEIDGALATRLAGHMAGQNVTVLCEDATRMSLPDGACDGAVSMTMLHHVPSCSKSPGFGFLTGLACWNALRLATSSQVPLRWIRATPLGVVTPCEQPAPASSAYMAPSMNAMSATPLVRLPDCMLVWLEGSVSVTVLRWPCLSMREIRPPVSLPV